MGCPSGPVEPSWTRPSLTGVVLSDLGCAVRTRGRGRPRGGIAVHCDVRVFFRSRTSCRHWYSNVADAVRPSGSVVGGDVPHTSCRPPCTSWRGVHPGTTPAAPSATKQNKPHGEGDFHSGDAPSPFRLSDVIGGVLFWTLIGAALMFAIGIIVVIVVFWTFWSNMDRQRAEAANVAIRPASPGHGGSLRGRSARHPAESQRNYRSRTHSQCGDRRFSLLLRGTARTRGQTRSVHRTPEMPDHVSSTA
jgi:hypothetical protein